MKTSIFFLSIIFSSSTVLAQNVESLSSETLFAYNLVCSNEITFNQLKQSNPNFFQRSVIMKRENFKLLLESAPTDILKDIEDKNFKSAAFTCAVIDELTSGFSLDCFDSQDQKLDLKKSQEACQILINSYN